MKVKFKKLVPVAQLPTKAHEHDAGWDIYATSESYPSGGDTGLYVEYGTGLAMEVPRGYVALLFPRSSVSSTRHSLRNSVGVIDCDYRGEIKLRFTPDEGGTGYTMGDKIGQLVFVRLPKIEIEEVDSLSATSRSGGGFGSSGV